MRLLIIENDEVLLSELENSLIAEGYEYDIIRSSSAALAAIATQYYDIILFNILSLAQDEMLLLRFLKGSRLFPKTILTYQPDNTVGVHKMEALNMINIQKPYTFSLLHTLILSMRRYEKLDGDDRLFYKELVIDVPGRAVKVKDQLINLTRREFDLLHLLVTNKAKVLSKNSLALYIGKTDKEEPTNHGVLYAHMKNLKKKLKSAGCEDYIRTVYGIGYQFQEP